MRTPSDWGKYAVEIRIPFGSDVRVGSGYLIAPGRILTALHVVIGALDDGHTATAPAEINVRAYGDFLDAFGDLVGMDISRTFEAIRRKANDDFLWRTAKLTWPRLGRTLPRLDLAILEVRQQHRLKRVAEAPTVDWLSPERDVPCTATGFPVWACTRTADGAAMSKPIPVTADLNLGLPRIGAMRDLTVTRSKPTMEADWQGLSGTVFLHEESGQVIGVASKSRFGKFEFSDQSVCRVRRLSMRRIVARWM